jgi:hypothetical protein
LSIFLNQLMRKKCTIQLRNSVICHISYLISLLFMMKGTRHECFGYLFFVTSGTHHKTLRGLNENKNNRKYGQN